MPPTQLIRIEAPHFVAAVEVAYKASNDPPSRVVIATAPILKYMRWWTEARVLDYCASKGWTALLLDTPHEQEDF